MKTTTFFRTYIFGCCLLLAYLFIPTSYIIASPDIKHASEPDEIVSAFNLCCHQNIYSGDESDPIHEMAALLIINSLDTVVFDFSMAICTPGMVQVPVFILSDDPVYALDFEMKFNPSEFSYNSLISHKPYLNNSANFHIVDSTLRFSAYSMIPMDNNSPLISLRFNLPSGSLGLGSFYSLRTWLNGDDCSFKSINLPPAPPIIPGGITSLNAGDSLLLEITVPFGSTNLWSNGATAPSTWVYNAGTYSVAVTNSLGCSASSFITVTLNNPLPVELLTFVGEVLDNGIFIQWTTAAEVNNHYFILQHSSDGMDWNFISRIEGSGTTSSLNQYQYFSSGSFEAQNYCRLQQFDFDGTVRNSEVILLKDSRNPETESDLRIYPNPYRNGDDGLIISIPEYETSGTIVIMEPGGRVIRQIQSEVFCNGNSNCIVDMNRNQLFQKGIYLVKWFGKSYSGNARFMVY